eukprot:Skav227579  [mRNA]  locus=scaffold517:152135:158515:- [translate_table: standard]
MEVDEIVEQREKDVASAKAQKPSEELQTLGEPSSRPVVPGETSAAEGFGTLSDINPDLDAAEQALQYTQARAHRPDLAAMVRHGHRQVGASVLSVLTEPKWFKGSLEDLKQVRQKTQDTVGRMRIPR